MSDFLLVASGLGGMLIAIVHGVIGQRRILARMNGAPAGVERVNRAVFHLSTLYWLLGGMMLTVAPFLLEPSARQAVAITVAAVYVIGGLGNVWATRGCHFGGPLLIIVAALGFAGA